MNNRHRTGDEGLFRSILDNLESAFSYPKIFREQVEWMKSHCPFVVVVGLDRLGSISAKRQRVFRENSFSQKPKVFSPDVGLI
jgi:hypothetical protein